MTVLFSVFDRIDATRAARAVTLAIVCFITFFVNNDVIVPDIMESRNIITAREMVTDSNWIVTTMNGEYRFEKPPFPTWCTALAEAAAPDNLTMQRGMAGAAAVILTLFFYLFASRVLRTEPMMPTLLLLTCYNVILMGRTASWDIYCHAFMAGGIYFLARALMAPGKATWHFLLAGIFTGLSVMSKGPVSLYALFLPFLISYCIFFRPSAKGKWSGILLMTVAAITIGCWWYAYIYIFHSDTMMAVARKESGAWVSHNVRPWWYYWQFFLEAGVWSLLLLTSIFLPLLDRRAPRSRAYLFAMTWMFASLILLSFLPEKKPRYLLPLLIPASYMMGCTVSYWRALFAGHSTGSRAETILFRINAWLLAAVIAALPAAAWFALTSKGYLSYTAWGSFSIFFVCIAVYTAMTAIRRKPAETVVAVTLLFLTAEIFGFPSLRNIINNPDRHSIELTRSDPRLTDIPFFHDADEPLRIELVYAAHRKIRPLDLSDSDTIESLLPCAVLTHGDAAEYLDPKLLERADTLRVGVFDDNRRPRSSKRYNPTFLYVVTLLTPKN